MWHGSWPCCWPTAYLSVRAGGWTSTWARTTWRTARTRRWPTWTPPRPTPSPPEPQRKTTRTQVGGWLLSEIWVSSLCVLCLHGLCRSWTCPEVWNMRGWGVGVGRIAQSVVCWAHFPVWCCVASSALLWASSRGDYSLGVNMGSNSIPKKLMDENINRGLICAHMHSIAQTEKILPFKS